MNKLKKLIIIKKNKKFSHVIGTEFEERYFLDKVTRRYISNMIGDILNEYYYEKEIDFEEYQELENLVSGVYHISLSDFDYRIEVIPSKLEKKIDEYDEFYDFQLQAFDAVYNFFVDESMVGIDETHTYKIDNVQTVTDYVITNQKESTVGFLRIIKGNDFYSYEIN